MLQRTLHFSFVVMVFFFLNITVFGQEDSNAATPDDQKSSATPAKPSGEAAQAWQEAFEQWKQLLAKLRDLKAEFKTAPAAQKEEIKKKYFGGIDQGREMLPKVRQAAIKAYLESPNEDRELARWLITLTADHLRADEYEDAVKMAKILLDNQCEDPAVYNLAGIAAFATNEYEIAGQYFELARKEGILSDDAKNFASEVEDYKTHWEEEQQFRKKDTESSEKLPRVLFKTSQGDITLELFENEAPQTVGNFVNLVEKGFYDGLTFHRVLRGFMAQGGDPQGNGEGGPGYRIYCECYKKEYRKHFRGSLSMAKEPARDTGGSQFFLNFAPTGHLNGKHTVFGRVVEGLEVLSKLKKRTPESTNIEPDKIISAKVLNKRDHEYVPTKVK